MKKQNKGTFKLKIKAAGPEPATNAASKIPPEVDRVLKGIVELGIHMIIQEYMWTEIMRVMKETENKSKKVKKRKAIKRKLGPYNKVKASK